MMAALLTVTPIIGLISGYISYRLNKTSEFLPWYYRLLNLNKPDYPIKGYVAKGYDRVKDLFIKNFTDGLEVGASVSIYVDNSNVVELYGGYEDFERAKIYDENTLNFIYSSSKFMESVAVAIMVNKGLLDYNEKISKYWPEFGCNGKEDVTLTDLMRHEAGVCYFNDPQPSINEIKDSDLFSKRLANQPHIFEGKNVRSYHGITRGWYLNELIKRVDKQKRSLSQIYADEINSKLGVEFYVGLPNQQDLLDRKAKWYDYPIMDYIFNSFRSKGNSSKHSSMLFKEFIKKTSHMKNLLKLKLSESAPYMGYPNTDECLEVEIPSVNGFSSANSLAKIASAFSSCLNQSTDHVDIVSSEAAGTCIGEATKKFDEIILEETTMTKGGFGVLDIKEIEVGTVEKGLFYGWWGFGGSIVVFNPTHNFAFSYVMNAQHMVLSGEGRGYKLLKEAFTTYLSQKYPNL